jgi:CRISPR-associated endonuclease/helicase Cas3
VVGGGFGRDGAELEAGARAVYGTLKLARTTALLDPASACRWKFPDDLPRLVEAVYDDDREIAPPEWRAYMEAAARDEVREERRRADDAAARTLSDPHARSAETLVGLHSRDSRIDTNDDAVVSAAVRDGDPTVEVVVVRHRDGRFLAAADGRSLGVNGEAVATYEQVAGSTIRLPARLRRPGGGRPIDLTAKALQLGPLPAWHDHPRLRHMRVWCLDHTDLDAAGLPGVEGVYDRRLGLTLEVRDA